MREIDGQDLKQMLLSGANNLYNFYPEIDALNVFPVPDGDTGMNMNLTMTSGSKEIQNRSDTNIFEISKAFSRGLLMGARGNSGVITSQIFRGLSQGLSGKEKVNAVELAEAFENAVAVAYKAVVRPVEGTILTVVRESVHFMHEQVKESTSIERAMEYLIEEANQSLNRTPELLPILKEVGVVDSGGAGLIKIYDGMLSALKGKFIERNQEAPETNPIQAAGAQMESDEFGYCTEFIMRLGPEDTKKPFNQARFTTVLESHGNSLVVVKDEDIVKVHVHTLNPGAVLTYAQGFGEFIKLKIENMTEQHHALEGGADEKNSLLNEGSSEDKPAEEVEENLPKEKFAMVAVSSGSGIDVIFEEAGIKSIVKGGQTMNPSSEDFVKAIKKANADNVFIFPNNSNIVMAASQACDMVEDVNAFVIPSKTIPQGISAAIRFNPEATVEENFKEMKSALKNVKSGEVTFSIRDTEINGVSMKKDDFIGIFEKEIVIASKDRFETITGLIKRMVDEMSSIITIIYGADVNEEEANKVANYIQDNLPDVDIDMRAGNQPIYSYLVGIE